ncbi:hypothetical protein DL768_001241 [Monosporascus sp. mg162]|nr:hypothetical protein DL768_001241 [Monosporascus sp. mg162]
MVGFTAVSLSTLVVLLAAVAYQIQLPRLLTVVFGLGRKIEPLSSFPYTCRRIEDERLQACEDMWLSERSRQLFLACSDSKARTQWHANMARYNASGRSLRDAFVILDIDEPVGAGFRMRTLKTPGFTDMLHFNGFTGNDDYNGDIRLWAVNGKPSVDAVTGEFLDSSKVGANMTVELFRLNAGEGEAGPADELEHVMTFHHPLISTANRVAAVINEDKPDFWFTNDHGQGRFGWRYRLSSLLRTGDVCMCRRKACWKVAEGLRYPNGLAKGHDGLIYVPSSAVGSIDVFEHVPRQGFKKLHHIDTDYSLDNLSVDKNGDIYAAAFPRPLQMLRGADDPFNSRAPAAALKISKKGDGAYVVEKVIEDGDAEVLPATTTVLHDAKTGRLFFSGVYSPFIAPVPKTEHRLTLKAGVDELG